MYMSMLNTRTKSSTRLSRALVGGIDLNTRTGSESGETIHEPGIPPRSRAHLRANHPGLTTSVSDLAMLQVWPPDNVCVRNLPPHCLEPIEKAGSYPSLTLPKSHGIHLNLENSRM